MSVCRDQQSTKVYPHVYGGNNGWRNNSGDWYGLSPCVRGKLTSVANTGRCAGSIPMCTGETATKILQYVQLMVYPHVYGGNFTTGVKETIASGLSPCVRGKPSEGVSDCVAARSIPMCTGETEDGTHETDVPRVYPHVYGGNQNRTLWSILGAGLSPCVRGKLMAVGLHRLVVRSIPMCTGETNAEGSAVDLREVYPHVYGGNWTGQVWSRSVIGLSPCVRGKRVRSVAPATQGWSIPMCTGETCWA